MQEAVRIVLVATSHPGNIGAVARAMKNMCMANLVLVEPREFPSEAAISRASGAQDVLDNAKVVASLEEALEGCVWVVGASARMRHLPRPVVTPRELPQHIEKRAKDGPIAIVFGREHSGLTNEELQRCHYHVHIPTNPDYSSLNLAMAVQVICYELFLAKSLELPGDHQHMKGSVNSSGEERDVLASVDDLEGLFTHLEQALVDIGFYDRDNPRQLMPRLRRLFSRAEPEKSEISILRGILKAVQKKAGTWRAEDNNSPR